jgi:hypothetical protein
LNCLEFRRVKLSDPRTMSPQALLHQKSCPHCHALACEIDEIEQKLDRFAEQSIPAGLEERILLSHDRRSVHRIRTLALAATVLLVASVGFFGWNKGFDKDPAQMAIEHVVNEPKALVGLRNDDTAFFEKVLADFGGRLRAPLGKVRYMKLCAEAEGNGWHVVLETEQGLATLMLIPGNGVNAQRFAASHGWHALVEPAGRGYYAIVTQTPGQTEALQELIRERVNWS